MFNLRALRPARLGAVFGCFTALAGPATAQAPGAASAAAGAAGLSCAAANSLLVGWADGSAPDAPIYHFGNRSDADLTLRRLTDLALSSPRCGAAYGIRALVKWRLSETNWVPKDAPGQRPGIPWNLDAIYDLAEAGKAGGADGAISATIATELMLPEVPPLPFVVREVGPGLLAAFNGGRGALDDTILQYQRGRLAAWLWEPATADSAFTSYVLDGGAPDLGALELARIHLAVGQADGDSLYYAAARSADSTVVRELRRDLAWIADSAELAAFDTTAPATRVTWLHDFWESRDLAEVRERGARLAEHYRRIGFVRQHFRLLSMDRKYELNELWRNRRAPYDDRGLIFIRHGEPDDTASATRAGACPNVSWLYRRPEGNLVFHFVARENPDDWRLVETLANVGGGTGASTRLRQADPSQRSCAPVDGLLESRASLDPIYSRLAVSESRRNWERELAFTTHSREVGTTTDSDPLRFPVVLNVAWRGYGLLGSSPGEGRILLLSSVAGQSLIPLTRSPLGYGFRQRLVLRGGGRALEIDSTRLFRLPTAPAAGEMLTYTTELHVAPRAWTVGIMLEQPADSAGQVVPAMAVHVPDAGASALQMSDIVLGASQGGRPWQAPDGPFPLSATGTYQQGEPVPIYYELAGAVPGAALQTEVDFAREDSRDKSTLKFSEPASGRIVRVRREIDTGRLKEGRYTMTVKVSPERGEPVTRTTSIFVTRP